MKRNFFIASFLSLLLAPSALFAHSLGNSWERETGGYLIDVGYSEPALHPLVPTQLDFHLYETKDGKPERLSAVPFTNAWVRISEKEKGFLFAGWLHQPSFGAMGMNYAFPFAGEYEMSVRFLKEDGGENKTIAETVFSFPVSSAEKAPLPVLPLTALLSAIIGFGGGVYFKKRKNV